MVSGCRIRCIVERLLVLALVMVEFVTDGHIVLQIEQGRLQESCPGIGDNTLGIAKRF